jgi:hypothetical protein
MLYHFIHISLQGFKGVLGISNYMMFSLIFFLQGLNEFFPLFGYHHEKQELHEA